MITDPTGPTRSAAPSSSNQYRHESEADTRKPSATVIAKPTADHTAAVNLRVARKYRTEIPGVSFIPMPAPTPSPATCWRVATIAANTPATSTRLICPKSRVLRTGSNHSVTAVHSNARRCHVTS